MASISGSEVNIYSPGSDLCVRVVWWCGLGLLSDHEMSFAGASNIHSSSRSYSRSVQIACIDYKCPPIHSCTHFPPQLIGWATVGSKKTIIVYNATLTLEYFYKLKPKA